MRTMYRQLDEREEGFTLIELLVVVIIIGILAAIAIPVFLNQREKAYDAAAKSDVRNAQTAMETYFTDNSAYTATSGDLTTYGLSTSDGMQALEICLKNEAGGTANAYEISGKHTQSANYWVFDSAAGSLSSAAAAGDCT